VCDICWDGLPSRLRRAVSRLPARSQAQWAAGRREVQPAARKKRTPHGRPPPAAREAPAAAPAATPARLSFLPTAPPAAEEKTAPSPASPAPSAPLPSAALRREQARIRRAALIADQLGDADLPFYFVDFMAVEDLSPSLGFDGAVAEVARRDGRSTADIEGAWHDAVARLAEDERCRYVDALRPYLDRIEQELE
jgi:hypothetical protein